MLNRYTSDKEEQEFILDNIINSPEWLKYGLIDTGYISNPYTHEFVSKSSLLKMVDGYVFSYQEHMIKPYVGIYNTLINRYSLLPAETLFIDDNQKNIDTGNKLGIISKKVEPDNCQNVIDLVNEMNLI